jgi:putative membrane protein
VKGFVVSLVVTAIAFLVVTYVLPEIKFTGDIPQLALLALVFGVVNGLIKPVVKLLSFPINALTLGLFGLVVNGALFLLVAWVGNEVLDLPLTVGGFPQEGLSVQTFITATIAAFVMGIVTTAIGLIVKD